MEEGRLPRQVSLELMRARAAPARTRPSRHRNRRHRWRQEADAASAPVVDAAPWSIVVAALLVASACRRDVDSYRVGVGWGERRPAGRLLPVLYRPDPVASRALVTLVADAARAERATEAFVDAAELRARAGGARARRSSTSLLIGCLGIYVAVGALHRLLHDLARQVPAGARSCRRRRRDRGRALPRCSRSGSWCRCPRARSSRWLWATERGIAATRIAGQSPWKHSASLMHGFASSLTR